MVFKALRSLKPINPLGKILGVSKDRYGRNMAITPDAFSKKVHKLNIKGGTNADFMKIADNLDDTQLNHLIEHAEAKEVHEKELNQYGVGGGFNAYDSAIKWNLKTVKGDRERGERKEKKSKESD